MNSVRSKLRNQMFIPSGCKEKGIRKFEFVANGEIFNHHILINI